MVTYTILLVFGLVSFLTKGRTFSLLQSSDSFSFSSQILCSFVLTMSGVMLQHTGLNADGHGSEFPTR